MFKNILGSNGYFVNRVLHQTGEFICLRKKNMVIFLGLFVVQGEDVVLPAPLPKKKKKNRSRKEEPHTPVTLSAEEMLEEWVTEQRT